jgi:hypothetical protein
MSNKVAVQMNEFKGEAPPDYMPYEPDGTPIHRIIFDSLLFQDVFHGLNIVVFELIQQVTRMPE